MGDAAYPIAKAFGIVLAVLLMAFVSTGLLAALFIALCAFSDWIDDKFWRG